MQSLLPVLSDAPRNPHLPAELLLLVSPFLRPERSGGEGRAVAADVGRTQGCMRVRSCFRAVLCGCWGQRTSLFYWYCIP